MRQRQIFQVIALGDPALARLEPKRLGKYGASRKREDLPDELAAEPTVFHFRRITRSVLFGRVDSATNDSERFAKAFAAGLVKVTGGRFGEGWEPEEAERMTDDELDLFDPYEIKDVGQVIYIRSNLGKDSRPSFPLLPSSLLAWDAIARRSAEEAKDAPQPNAAPSEG